MTTARLPRSQFSDRQGPRWLDMPPMRHPNEYVWFVFFSSLDVMLTWVILGLGGVEINPLAALVIDAWSLPGAIGFKFALMLFVILICEELSRRKEMLARKLAMLAVAVSAVPPLLSVSLLALHVLSSSV